MQRSYSDQRRKGAINRQTSETGPSEAATNKRDTTHMEINRIIDVPDDLALQLLLGAFYGMASESFSSLLHDAYPMPE